MDIDKNPLKDLSKPEKIAVIGGTVAISGFLVYSHHKKTGKWNPWNSGNAASSTGSDSTGTDPVTGLPYSEDNTIDPITGLAYLAEATQYGSVATAEASVSAYGSSTASGSGIGVNPAFPPPAGSSNTVVGTSVYTSNSAWAQAATAGLADVGYSATDVATALGDYLTGTPVTATQASLINTAIAEYGPAPTGNLQVILAPASGTGTTTTTGTGTTTPPAPKAGAISNLQASVSGTTAKITWNSAPDAPQGYAYKLTELNDTVVKASTTSAKSVTVTGLHKGWTYNFAVQGLPGGPGNNIHITIQ